jgi:ribosomal protein S19E (S16A)
MQRISDMKALTETQMLAYILGSISEGKNEEQIVERFDGDKKLVRIWVETLQQIGFVIKNSFNELVVTQDGENYLKYDLHR